VNLVVRRQKTRSNGCQIMNSQDDTPAANLPRRMHPVLKLIPVVALAAVILAIIINSILPPRWHPTLEVENTGTNAVTISFRGEAFLCRPGQTWHMRFYGGDTLTLSADEAVDHPSFTITLPDRNPKPWTFNPIAQRWTADVNADDPKNIRFENRRFEEVSSPPSASEPWP
jgi:hypothetical protein